MLLRHGPAFVRNLFSRLHWPRGRSIPGSWMVGSLINDLIVWDINDLPPYAPEVLDGGCLIREVRPYRTSRFQSWSGVKVNIGEQSEFRPGPCPENHSRCCHLSADVCRGNVT